jgi:sulfate permease, SulP family
MPPMTATRAASAPDLVAGLSIAGLLLPEAVAYSHLAGLAPQAGVIALFAGLICYGLIGSSRFAIVSATSSSAAVLASAMVALGAAGAERAFVASILVIGAGVAFALCAALRLGDISVLIARPVLRGYAFGLALVIAVKQWPTIAGVEVPSAGFFALIGELVHALPAWQVPSLGCGIGALAGLFLLGRLRRVPGALLVISGGILAAPWLSAHGVALTGPIDLTPALPGFALPESTRWPPLAGFALALMFILYAESYGSIRTYALKHDDAVRPNRDLCALGVANVVAGLLQGTPVGAGYSATSANEAAGAQSRHAGLIAAAAVLLGVAVLLRWIERIPEPVLAAIVIHAVSKSLRIGAFRDYFRWQRDWQVALAAVLAVLLFGVLYGLLAAIAFSLAWLLRSLASPRLSVLGSVGAHDYVSVARFPQARTERSLLVMRPEAPLFFANADSLFAAARALVRARPEARVIVLSLEESPDLDSTSLETLAEFCSWLAARRAELRVARLKERAREALVRAALPELGGAALDYSSVDDAVRGECVVPTAPPARQP